MTEITGICPLNDDKRADVGTMFFIRTEETLVNIDRTVDDFEGFMCRRVPTYWSFNKRKPAG